MLGVFWELSLLAFSLYQRGKHAEAFACIMRYSLALMAVEKCLKNVYALFAFLGLITVFSITVSSFATIFQVGNGIIPVEI